MLQQENPAECSLLRLCQFCNSCSEILRGDGGTSPGKILGILTSFSFPHPSCCAWGGSRIRQPVVKGNLDWQFNQLAAISYGQTILWVRHRRFLVSKSDFVLVGSLASSRVVPIHCAHSFSREVFVPGSAVLWIQGISMKPEAKPNLMRMVSLLQKGVLSQWFITFVLSVFHGFQISEDNPRLTIYEKMNKFLTL